LHIRNRRYNKRAVSSIIAALLLIAITVTAATLLYVFAIGLLGSLGASGETQTNQQIIMEAYDWPSNSSVLTFTLRNVGSDTENLVSTDYFVNGTPVSTAPTIACADGTASALAPTLSCAVIITSIPNLGSLIPGVEYPLRIVTPTGGIFSYPVTDGGSS